MRDLHVHRVLLLPIITAIAGAVLSPSIHARPAHEKQLTSSRGAGQRVHIIKGPALESVKDNVAIIRWTSNNPGGTEEHFGVVHYGTDPERLSQTAQSHIRLNPNHPYTVFRVRVDGVAPQTTYYYKVDSLQGNGKSDGVKSALSRFKTP